MAKTLFVNGNPAQGILGTVVTAEFLNAVNNHHHTGRDVDGEGALPYAADTGAADAYAIALDPALSEYVTGMPIFFKAANTNTGASTLNVNGLGAKAIKKHVGAALDQGDIVPNQIVMVIYDGANFQMELNGSSPAMYVQDSRNNGTAGDLLSAGAWNQRVLQTVVYNTIPGASLANNQVTLPAGIYDIIASAGCFTTGAVTNLHKTRLRNITDGTTLLVGLNEYAYVANAGSTIGNTARLCGRILLTAQKVIELDHYTAFGGDNRAVSSGEKEIYADIFINKVT